MAKNEKKNAEKDLEQVSGGYMGYLGMFNDAERDRQNVRNAGKEPKHELGYYVQSMVNKLEGK